MTAVLWERLESIHRFKDLQRTIGAGAAKTPIFPGHFMQNQPKIPAIA
jgi:hypothetical protein